jgi:phage terminase large subunit
MALYKRGKRKVGGIDWGWTNPGASVWGAWTEDGGTFVVIGEWYHAGRQIEDQGAYIAKHAKGVSRWFCDSAEPRSIYKLKHGFKWGGKPYAVTATEADKAWQAGTDTVRNLMHRRPGLDHPAFPPGNGIGSPRLYISEKCVNLIREFREYRDAYDPEDDKEPKEGDTVGDDHAIDALRYAIYTSTLKREARTTWQPGV